MEHLKLLNWTPQSFKFNIIGLESLKLNTLNHQIGHGRPQTFKLDTLNVEMKYDILETFKLNTQNPKIRHGKLETFKLKSQTLKLDTVSLKSFKLDMVYVEWPCYEKPYDLKKQQMDNSWQPFVSNDHQGSSWICPFHHWNFVESKNACRNFQTFILPTTHTCFFPITHLYKITLLQFMFFNYFLTAFF
jgi:hypothetical protein